MVPPKGGAISAVLQKFRSDFVKNAKVTAAASKEREDKLKQKPSSSRKQSQSARRDRGKQTTSSDKATKGATTENNRTKNDDMWMNEVKLPLGMRQKQVLDFLRDKEAPASMEEILNSTGRNIETEMDLRKALDAHPKISVDQSTGQYSYIPEANVRNKKQLLDYVRLSGAPVPVTDVLDSYKQVTEDIAILKKENAIFGIHSYHPEVNCEVLYANDPGLTDIGADADVSALWANFPIPDADEDIDEVLKKANLMPAPRKEKPKRILSEKKKKKRKQARLRSVTNAHLMHLLEGEGPTMIDG